MIMSESVLWYGSVMVPYIVAAAAMHVMKARAIYIYSRNSTHITYEIQRVTHSGIQIQVFKFKFRCSK